MVRVGVVNPSIINPLGDVPCHFVALTICLSLNASETSYSMRAFDHEGGKKVDSANLSTHRPFLASQICTGASYVPFALNVISVSGLIRA